MIGRWLTCLSLFWLCLSSAAADSAESLLRAAEARDKSALGLVQTDETSGPAAENAEIWSYMGPNEIWARNVTQPTLLPVLPEPEVATGAAILVIPGGGFRFVSMGNEGYPIADWLAAQGIAAFVLKYRVMATPADDVAFSTYMQQIFERGAGDLDEDRTGAVGHAVADAQAALELIHARQEDWGLDPDRIGVLGFSAGAMTALGLIQAPEPGPHPAFGGYIYGPMSAIEVADDAPPLFVALATDDPLFGAQGFGLVESWLRAGASAELHAYQGGGHGFGSKRTATTSDAWFGDFMTWLEVNKIMPAPPPNGAPHRLQIHRDQPISKLVTP